MIEFIKRQIMKLRLKRLFAKGEKRNGKRA
jgi:hypothetical protein